MERPDAIFVGAELEDNLSIRTLAAAVRAAGRSASTERFDGAADVARVAGRIVAQRPALVGLSMAFQHRAAEFVGLAAALRAQGYRGHICAGGHVPTVMPEEVLASGAVDTVLAHEAEEGIVRLLGALGDRAAWPAIPALGWRGDDGALRFNPPAPARRDLDAFPLPVRETPLRKHLGLPFVPLWGSRGCYGSCSFCAISTFHKLRPGPRLRFRSPDSVAAEMATLYHELGARIFCLHDETMLLPRPAQSRERLDALAAGLRARGVGRIAVVGKARPDAIEPGLLGHLRESLGLMRLYVGIENWSPAGLAHLGRGVTAEENARALEACRAEGVYGCYNLLIFEPETTLEDLEDNVRGMGRFPDIPVNFCRAEAYAGTPLWTRLREQGRLRAEGFATDYTLQDPQARLAFRIVREAFRDRNFAADGLANMTMSFGYERQLLRHFLPAGERGLAELVAEVDALILEINGDTRDRLARVLEFVRSPASADAAAVAATTFELATEINLGGAVLQERLIDLRRAMNLLAERSGAWREVLAPAPGR
jgi:radical SAM superfamily enzyme YgiQ (UPF0313 family)